jgi:hypothetical protein
MHERCIDMQITAGPMVTCITHPEAHGPFPAVIPSMDVRGQSGAPVWSQICTIAMAQYGLRAETTRIRPSP